VSRVVPCCPAESRCSVTQLVTQPPEAASSTASADAQLGKTLPAGASVLNGAIYVRVAGPEAGAVALVTVVARVKVDRQVREGPCQPVAASVGGVDSGKSPTPPGARHPSVAAALG